MRETRSAHRILVGYPEEWRPFGTSTSRRQYNIRRSSGKN
jgi:hypothetical protein